MACHRRSGLELAAWRAMSVRMVSTSSASKPWRAAILGRRRRGLRSDQTGNDDVGVDDEEGGMERP